MSKILRWWFYDKCEWSAQLKFTTCNIIPLFLWSLISEFAILLYKYGKWISFPMAILMLCLLIRTSQFEYYIFFGGFAFIIFLHCIVGSYRNFGRKIDRMLKAFKEFICRPIEF